MANVAADDSMEKTMSLLGAVAGKRNNHVTKRECLAPREMLEKVPNTDAGSLDDNRNAFQLIQNVVRLRPIHAKAALDGRGQGGLFA